MAEADPGAQDRVFLVGLSGSGKSTVARIAAQRLGWRWRDTDAMVRRRTGMDIARVFERFGESEFRRMERDCLLKTLEERRVIVATGGGLPLDERNRSDMRRSGIVVYLRTSPEACARHLRASKRGEVRPLLDGEGTLETRLRDQLATRAPFYGEAQVVLDGDANSVEELAGTLVEAMGRLGNVLSSQPG